MKLLGMPRMRDALAKTGRPIVFSTEWDPIYFKNHTNEVDLIF